MRRKSFPIILMALVLLAAACGGRQAIYESRTGSQTATARTISLPAPVPAAPAYLATLKKAAPDKRIARVSKTRGVAVVAEVATARLPVKGPDGKKLLTVGAIDPFIYRSVAPASTRDAEFVWSSLLAGDAVVTFDAAEKLGLGRNDDVRIGGRAFRIGAFADNGTPNVADVLVDAVVGSDIGASRTKMLAIGAKSGVTVEALGRDLRAKLPGARWQRLVSRAAATAAPAPAAPAVPAPVGAAEGGLIGRMTFRILRNGFIEPDPAWVASNIATGSVPIIGTVRCHRLMFPQLRAALGEIERRGLSRLIHTGDFGGCYVPRFIDRDPRKALSMHAFGLAVDFNVASNQLGTRGDIDPRVVAIFEKWGFNWGGRWARPDPMHFELARLISG